MPPPKRDPAHTRRPGRAELLTRAYQGFVILSRRLASAAVAAIRPSCTPGSVHDPQRRQGLGDTHRLQRDGGDAFDEVEDVAGVADLAGPVVGVVDDAGGLVGADLVAVEDPVQGG